MATRTVEAPPAAVRPPREAVARVAQPNPLREGLRHERMAEPCTMIICGATGDLTERKLAPALHNTFLGRLPAPGVHRRRLRPTRLDRCGVPRPPAGRDQQVQPQQAGQAGDLGLDRRRDRVPARRLQRSRPRTPSSPKRLDRIDRDRGTAGNRLFYLAVPPSLYPEIVNQLDRAGLAASGEHRRERLEAGLDARHRREAVRLRPRVGADPEPRDRRGLRRGPGLSDRPLPRQGDRPEPRRSSASGTACSSRSGTVATSTRSRSRWPRRSASRAAASSTTRPAPCATWSRTTASS